MAKKIGLVKVYVVIKRVTVRKLIGQLSVDFESKIDIAIKYARYLTTQWNISGKLFIENAWHLTTGIIKCITQYKTHYLLNIKNNRIFETKSGDKISAAKLVTSKAGNFVSIDEKTSGLFIQVFLRKVGFVSVVLLKNKKNGVRIFITDLSSSKGKEKHFLAMIADHVHKHWTIEERHKKLNVLELDNYCGNCGNCARQGLKKHAAMLISRYMLIVFLSVQKKWRTLTNNLKVTEKPPLSGIFHGVNALLLKQLSNLKVKYILNKCRVAGLGEV